MYDVKLTKVRSEIDHFTQYLPSTYRYVDSTKIFYRFEFNVVNREISEIKVFLYSNRFFLFKKNIKFYRSM